MNNHALRLVQLGRPAEALTVSEEAVRLRRELVAQNRDGYLPDLAMSLTNHALRLAEAGRPAALATNDEAVQLYRGLVDVNRDAYLGYLAAALWGVGHVRLLLDEPRYDAIPAATEALGYLVESDDADDVRDAAKLLADLYAKTGDDRAAEDIRARYHLSRD